MNDVSGSPAQKIVPPTAGKKIIVGIVNMILFIVYVIIVQFLFGFVAGIFVGFGVLARSTFDATPFRLVAGLGSILVVIILTIIFRRKIYFRVTGK